MKLMEKLVYFKNKSQKLYGVMHYPENPITGKVPCVVMFHGFTGYRAEAHFLFAKLARKLAREGIAVLRFDFRGSGDSEGLFSDMTVEEEMSDARAALDFVKTQEKIDIHRIGVLGLSMGGFVCAYTAGNYSGIKSAVLMSAVARFWSLWQERLANGIKAADGSVAINGIKLNRYFVKALQKYDGLNLKAVIDYQNPLLVIHGENDPVVPAEDGKLYYAVSASHDKQLKIIKGAGHTYESRKHEEKAIKFAVDWFKETL